MSVSQAHKELFGRLYHSIWNERRMEFIPLVIAETHAISDPTIAGGAVGPSAYRRQVERFLTGLPDLHFEVDDTVTEKDKLVVYWTITGTHRGEFLGVPQQTKKFPSAASPSIRFARAKSSNPPSFGTDLAARAIWDRVAGTLRDVSHVCALIFRWLLEAGSSLTFSRQSGPLPCFVPLEVSLYPYVLHHRFQVMLFAVDSQSMKNKETWNNDKNKNGSGRRTVLSHSFAADWPWLRCPRTTSAAGNIPTLPRRNTSRDRRGRKITAAQAANEWDTDGHAAKAKELLDEVNNELKLAAEAANHHK